MASILTRMSTAYYIIANNPSRLEKWEVTVPKKIKSLKQIHAKILLPINVSMMCLIIRSHLAR